MCSIRRPHDSGRAIAPVAPPSTSTYSQNPQTVHGRVIRPGVAARVRWTGALSDLPHGPVRTCNAGRMLYRTRLVFHGCRLSADSPSTRVLHCVSASLRRIQQVVRMVRARPPTIRRLYRPPGVPTCGSARLKRSIRDNTISCGRGPARRRATDCLRGVLRRGHSCCVIWQDRFGEASHIRILDRRSDDPDRSDRLRNNLPVRRHASYSTTSATGCTRSTGWVNLFTRDLHAMRFHMHRVCVDCSSCAHSFRRRHGNRIARYRLRATSSSSATPMGTRRTPRSRPTW